MLPNAVTYNPDPTYLRALITKSGLSQAGAASVIGISERVVRYYLAPIDSLGYRPAPYAVQFALESLTSPRMIFKHRKR